MKIIQDHPALRYPLQRTLRKLGLKTGSKKHLSDPRVLDHLLREIHAEDWLPEDLRAEVYTAFLGQGPGGLQAFGWLAEHGHLNVELVRDYLSCLPQGNPSDEALEEVAALEAAEGLFGELEYPPELAAGLAMCLLCSRALSARARRAVFRRLFSAPWFSAGARRLVACWAVGEELPEEVRLQLGVDHPEAPEALQGAGLLVLVQLGAPPDEVARLGLSRPSRESVAGLLDLVDLFGDRLDPELRRAILERGRRQRTAALRRRAYQLGGRTEGSAFLKLGLRDRDSQLRAWVQERVAASG